MRIMYYNKTCLLLLFLLSLEGCKKVASDDLIEFDVTGSYPLMTLDIQDVAEVEYLSPETNDDYLFSYFKGLSDSYVICENSIEKSLVFFSRSTGKPVSKVDRYGNGPEEYSLPAVSVYSEEKDELFVLDYPKGIMVYSRDGTFKRKLTFRERSYIGGPEAFYDFDAENLLYNDGFQGSMNNYSTAFVLVSKQDGHTTEEIQIPYEKKINLMFTQSEDGGAMVGTMPGTYYAVRSGRDVLLTDYSADTAYRFTPERELTPVLVRKPSIQTMESKIILHSWLDTDRYLFFSTEKLEFDWKELKGFPVKGYLMEKRSGQFYQARVGMKDYKGKELILGPSVLSMVSTTTRTGVVVFQAQELLDANKDGKLSGKLKEKVDRLTEDDELVLMVMTFQV